MRKYDRNSWLTEKGKKSLMRITKRNKRKKDSKKIIRVKDYEKVRNKIRVVMPVNFSITKNPEETINFFNYLISKINEKRINRIFFFDMSKVEYITVDAIMYLVAIIRNGKNNKKYKFSFTGNLPQNENAKNRIIQSGFLNFVHSKNDIINPKSNCVCIKTGENNNPELARQICDFVANEIIIGAEQKRALYNTLIELMSNTYNHAYKSIDEIIKINRAWYIYAEKYKNKIRFTFLDTGEGIASTIFKSNFEKFKEFFIKKSEEYYTLSAFTGTFRSETKNKYQSTGLPEIYSYCKKRLLLRFIVITDKTLCKIFPESDMPKLLKSKLTGTAFCWEINGEEDKYGN